MFVPDILLLVDYNSHNEKVDLLMNMSRRIAYISTTDFDKSRAWLVEYANYMHIDMFSESAYSVLTAQYLKELLASLRLMQNIMLHILSVYFQNKF